MNHRAAYEAYIQLVLKHMEAGTAPWHRPWSTPTPPSNLATRKAYRGRNALFLGLAATTKGSPWFLTYKQAAALGGHVRRGSKGYPVVYWNVGTREVEGPDGELETRRVPPRVAHVFSVHDVDGIEDQIPPEGQRHAPHLEADHLVSLMPNAPRIEYGHPKAFYVPARDVVCMPDRGLFDREADFQAVRFHELTHSTGHPSRLNRDTLVQAGSFGSYAYSREELVAEMGAGMLCALLGLENEVVNQNAAYLSSWHAELKKDPAALIWAANRAQNAVDAIATPWLERTLPAQPKLPEGRPLQATAVNQH